jgi:hypothetical protein
MSDVDELTDRLIQANGELERSEGYCKETSVCRQGEAYMLGTSGDTGKSILCSG